MARNGSGTYSKVNTFTSGATITASGHNQNWDDIATEMTNSVAADGQTAMTGALKAAAGTAAAPAVTFSSDTDTGIFRKTTNTLGFAADGVEVAYITTATAFFAGALVCSATAAFGAIGTASFTGPVSFSGTATFSATASFPVGFIASATSTFASGLIASATATFTTEAKVAGSAVVKQSDAATTSEVASETSGGAKYVTASTLKNSQRVAAAWASVTPAATPAIDDSFGFSSITRNGAGDYTLTLSTTQPNANYAVATGAYTSNGSFFIVIIIAKTTTTIRFQTLNLAGNTSDISNTGVSIVVFGDRT